MLYGLVAHESHERAGDHEGGAHVPRRARGKEDAAGPGASRRMRRLFTC